MSSEATDSPSVNNSALEYVVELVSDTDNHRFDFEEVQTIYVVDGDLVVEYGPNVDDTVEAVFRAGTFRRWYLALVSADEDDAGLAWTSADEDCCDD